MKTFPPALTAELAKKTGISPVWILKLHISGQDWYLSDAAWPVGPWGVTTLPLIASWGQIQEGISNSLGEYQVSEYSVDVISDPAAVTTFQQLFLTGALAFAQADLYIWARGLACAPALFSTGYVKRPHLTDELTVRLEIQDESVLYENHYIGRRVDLAAFPNADPDDVGRVIPIPYGSVSKLRAVALDAGTQTSLPGTITALQTSFNLSSGAGLESGVIITIDDEDIYIINLAGDAVTNCTRGYSGSIAAQHLRGAIVWESRDWFYYAAGDVPVNSLPKVYGRVGGYDLDITTVCTRYTGQPGNTHPAFPGMAIVAVPGYITVQQAVALLVNDGISITDAAQIYDQLALTDGIVLNDLLSVADNISVGDNITVADNIAISDPSHAHIGAPTTLKQYGTTPGWADSFGSASQIHLITWFPILGAQIQSSYSVTITCAFSGTVDVNIGGHSFGNTTTATWPFTATSGNGVDVWVTPTPGSKVFAVNVRDSQRDYTYIPSTAAAATGVSKNSATGAYKSGGSAYKSGGRAYRSAANTTKSGTVVRSANNTVKVGSQWSQRNGSISVHGNSVANTLVGDEILVDVVRNITLPGAVCADLNTLAGRTSFRQIGALPASYKLDFAITEYQTLQWWCSRLALQCRSWFRMHLGGSLLIVRQDNPVPVANITAVRLDRDGKKIWSVDPTDVNDIINSIALKYDRDWSASGSSEPYKQIVARTDAASIARYGLRERPDLFQFDMITDPTMAADVADFYIRFYAVPHHLHSFDRRLDFAHLEFGDCLQLNFCGGIKGTVQEAKLNPGSASAMDRVEFIVLI